MSNLEAQETVKQKKDRRKNILTLDCRQLVKGS